MLLWWRWCALHTRSWWSVVITTAPPLPSHPYVNLLKCRWKIKFKRQNFPFGSAQSQHPQEAAINSWNLHDRVRKQLLSIQNSHSTLSGIRCWSLEGFHKQNQKTPIPSGVLVLGIDGKEGTGEAPHWAGSWMPSHTTLRFLSHSPFSHCPFSSSRAAHLWTLLPSCGMEGKSCFGFRPKQSYTVITSYCQKWRLPQTARIIQQWITVISRL